MAELNFPISVLLVAILIAIVFCVVRFNSPYRSTEDAYVHGNQIFLTPRVTGSVVSIKADDTDLVVKGHVPHGQRGIGEVRRHTIFPNHRAYTVNDKHSDIEVALYEPRDPIRADGSEQGRRT